MSPLQLVGWRGSDGRLFGWSDGVVVPLTLELDQSRWDRLYWGFGANYRSEIDYLGFKGIL